MHGCIDPCMMALSTTFTKLLQYTQLTRTIRMDNKPYVDKIMRKQRALDVRNEIPRSAKKLCPDAHTAYSEMEQVMQSDDYISKINFPPIPPPGPN